MHIVIPSYSLARNLFVKLAASDPLVRYKASQALKHPWITRLHTEIPLNLFETIRRVKTNEQIDAVSLITPNVGHKSSSICRIVTRELPEN